MSGSPTNVNFSDTNPPPKPNSYNLEWQAGQAVPDTNSTGQYVADESACYRTPHVGGVIVLTDDYDLSEVDSGWTFICNSSTPFTLTLPDTIPQLPNPEGIWNVEIKNIGSGAVTVDPNGLNLDGSGSTVSLAQNSGFKISTDNTDYWTTGNYSTPLPTTDTFTGNGSTTAFTLTKAPAGGFAFVFWNAGGGIVLPTDYSISGTTLTTSFKDAGGNSIAAQSGDKIYVAYFA